ncbi:MAG: NAD(P)/FAD-dependent oxidoreductase [Nannocystaceae bacterium]
MADAPQDTTVVIIGAGFAGLCMGIKLKEAGLDDFVILEASDGVGGTWRANTYPGCACDVPSHLYSYSFAPRSDWSRKYGPQGEILDYIEACADRFGVRPFVRFGVKVVAATYDEADARWLVRAADGRRWRARFVVSALGSLRIPAIPAISGADAFAGAAFHSARWDHDYDLAGKRVAVVGTGASAIQFVPQIAAKVARLHLFQRTPPWIMPKADRPFTGAEKAIFRRLPAVERLYRAGVYWKQEAPVLGFLRAPKLLKIAELEARRHLRAQIADPQLRAKVTPSFHIGCKRVLLSNDYYPALTRANVEVHTEALAELRPRHAVTSDGRELPIDAVIYGTGFRITDFLAPMEVRGAGGQTLAERWRGGPEAYLGSAIHGFPNFFLITGPNTGLGHSSMVFMIEAHVHFIRACIRGVLDRGLRAVEVRADAERRFNARIQARLDKTVWSSGCRSWYLDESGRNIALWPGSTWGFWLRTRRPRRRDFAFT